MTYRIFRWLLWTVLISVTPFIAVLTLRAMVNDGQVDLKAMFGAGQMLITSVALLAGAIRELSGMDHDQRPRGRDSLTAMSFVLALIMAYVYGYYANETIAGRDIPADQQATLVKVSMVAFFASVLVGAWSLAVSHPKKGP